MKHPLPVSSPVVTLARRLLVLSLSGIVTASAALAFVAPAPAATLRLAQAAPPPGHDPAGSDTAPSRNAARSRMRECGHQWSSMKKTGAANGTTWKDFSQGCLAKQ